MEALPMPLICTTLQHGHGRRLVSAWRALLFQLHRLETWPSLRGVRGDVVIFTMPWICTAVLRVHGRRLSSAWRALILQLHLSETWPSSQEVRAQVVLTAILVKNAHPFAKAISIPFILKELLRSDPNNQSSLEAESVAGVGVIHPQESP